jgi:hypothetical protein
MSDLWVGGSSPSKSFGATITGDITAQREQSFYDFLPRIVARRAKLLFSSFRRCFAVC